MATIPMPANFDGSKFAKKYNLSFSDFRSDGDNLICPTLDTLFPEDLLDCIADPPKIKLSPSQQIILADGVSVARVYIQGNPNQTVEFSINGIPQTLELNADGTDSIELTSDTPNTTIVVQAGTAQAVIYAVEVPA